MDALSHLSSAVGIEPACAALGVARASYYRQRPLLGPSPLAQLPVECIPRPTPARALCADERQAIHALLNSEHVSRIARPPPSTPPCSMKANISAPHKACTASSNKMGQRASGATNSPIRSIGNRNCWPPRPTSSGVGISPNCVDPPSGPTFIFTSFWMSSAATSSAGWWRRAKARNWPANSFRSRVTSRRSSPTSLAFTPTGDPPCDPNPSLYCWPISASPRPTAAPTHPTTIHSRKVSFER